MLVSVVIPVYNAGKFLRETLDSIREQTLKDIEVICVDDGSTDDSPEILREYASADKRFKVIAQKNSGAGAARNAGLDAASGKYLSFLDADDRFHPDMLEKAVTAAEKDSADIAVFSYNRFESATGKTVSSVEFPQEVRKLQCPFAPADLPLHILYSFYNFACNKAVRRDFVAGHGIRFRNTVIWNDMFFSNMVVALAERITFVNEPLLDYRKTSGNNLQSKISMNPTIFAEEYRGLAEEFVKRGIYGRFKYSMLNALFRDAVYILMRMPDYEKFARHYAYIRGDVLRTFDFSDMTEDKWCSKNIFAQYMFISDNPDPFAFMRFYLEDKKDRGAACKMKNISLSAARDSLSAKNSEMKEKISALKEKNAELKSQNALLAKNNSLLKKKNMEIMRSWTYRTGRVFTFIPGRIKRFFSR